MAEDEWKQWKEKSSGATDGSADENADSSAEAPAPVDSIETSKEWRLIRTLVTDIQAEQIRKRRWGILFKSLTFAFLFLIAFGMWNGSSITTQSNEPHIAVLNINGVIMDGAPASVNNIVPLLNDAFENPAVRYVLLDINSPGGSPVQAGIIYDEIQRLKRLNPDKKVYGVIGDVGASGAYYIAAAADFIYADKASVVGSIGVIASGFGFTELIASIGVERRAYTAGDNKDFLDPFLAENPLQRAMMQELLDEVHQQFIVAVKQGRGERLAINAELFSGAFWSGSKALSLGLVDGLGDIYSVSRDHLGDLPMQNYEPLKTPLEEIIDKVGAQAKVQMQSFWQMPAMQ